MTTKNSEFEFNLQMFNSINEKGPSIGAANSHLELAVESVYSTAYSTSDTITVPAATEDEEPTTLDAYTDTYAYFAFQSTDATVASSIVTLGASVTETLVHGATRNETPTPAASNFTLTTAGANLTVDGGTDFSEKITLKGVGSIASLGGTTQIGLRADNTNVRLTGVNGELAIAPTNGVFAQTINGAAINVASMTANSTLTIAGSSNWEAPKLQADGAVSLAGVDTVQSWLANSSRSIGYHGLQVAGSGDATITVSGSSNDNTNNYLAATLGEGTSLSLNTLVANPARDTISVNGTVIGGAAKAGLVVTASPDSSSIMTATVGTGHRSSLIVGNITVGGGVSSIENGAKVTITAGAGTGSVAAITGVSALTNRGTWTLGSGVTAAQLGADTVTFANTGAGRVITADTVGTAVSAINGAASLNAVGDHTVSANGTAWTLDGGADNSTIGANFDASGNATLTATDAGEVNDLVARVGNVAGKTLAVGANGAADTLTMAANGEVTINNNVISAVNSIAGDSTWVVRGGTDARQVALTGATSTEDDLTFNFERANNASVYGALSKSTASGALIESIESLSGNVTVSHGASSIGMNVMGTNWSVAGEENDRVVFNSAGLTASVSVKADSDLSISAAVNAATVNVDAMAGVLSNGAHTMSGSFNGSRVIVNDSDGIIGVELESDTAASGISGITSLSSGATVIGDNQFTINDSYFINKAVQNAATSDIRVTMGSASAISVQNVADGDAYTVTGLSGQTIHYDLDSTVASGGNARVTLNGAAVTVDASTASHVGNAYVIADYNDAIATIGGVKANDTVQTASDRNFTVLYDTSNINDASSDPYVLAVNDARVSLRAANLTEAGNQSLSMAVAYDVGDATKPHVTISRGIANNVTVTVGAGVYNVGNSAQVTINDPVGYLYLDNNGNVTAEDSLVAEIRQQREASLRTALASIASASPIVGPYHDFYDIYANLNNHDYTVAAYADATVISPTVPASSNGANIYGDTTLSAHPQEVTLQTYLSNPVHVRHTEGSDNIATLRTAVIDVSNSNNTIVAVGYSGSDFTTNHTILGGNRASTLVVGSHAHGDNYVRAGNGGNYIYHTGVGKSTLLGGSGSDTIRATSDDYVEGGNGVDYFLDEGSFEITDYDFAGGAGDVIVATKLSTSAVINPANVTLSGNRIAIAGGSTLSVGDSSSYDEATATRAIVVNAAGSGRTNLIWAGNYDTALDASDLTRGAMMISYINGGAVNTVTGSANADTIYAGPNDIVDPGLGNDYVSLSAADTSTGQRGATVLLSSGKTDVYGWRGGFDNEAGANILQASAANVTFRSRSSSSGGPTVTAFSDGASVNFGDMTTDSTGAYNFLVGEEKVTFIGNESTVSVNSNADTADYYKGDKSAIYAAPGVDATFGITLGSDHFTGINKVALLNESRASIWGSSASESITLGGSADVGAVKSVASGAGNDLIVSGGNDTAKSGHYLFFGEYAGVTLSAGRDTIRDFSYYQGSDVDPDMSSADLLYLGDSRNFESVSATANRLEISLGETTKVIINDNFAQSSDRKIVRARFGDSDEIFNCKFGLSNGTNTFTYDGETNAFFGSTSRNNDTLKVDSSLTNVNIWLKDKNFDNKTYAGVRAIDASAVSETRATLVGDSVSNNIIVSAGTGSTNSLWGGGGQANTLIGGEGDDTFFYIRSVGYTDNDGVQHGSNDFIQNAGADDLIWLYDVRISDINADTTTEGIVSGRITVGLNDGSALTVTTTAASTNFRISDGNGGWQDFRATSGSNHGWE